MNNAKRGFTLIELSIVLVIIGLLIGGILTAQSLITTVRVQMTVRQIQQFDILINNFSGRYKGMPGDAASFGGDGDGVIASASGDQRTFDGEIATAWRHLQISGMTYKGTFSEVVGGGGFTSTGDSPNAPLLSIGDQGAVIIGNNVDANVDAGFRAYHIAKWAGTNSLDDGEPFISPADALAIDMKMDDGFPSEGVVHSNLLGFANNIHTDDCDDYFDVGDQSLPGNYKAGNSSEDCYMRVGINGQVQPEFPLQ